MSRRNKFKNRPADNAPPRGGMAPVGLAAQNGGAERGIPFGELGTSGLKAAYGYVQEAYNAQLYWPGVQSIYARLRTAMPEIVMIRNAFTAWGRDIKPVVEMPDEPSDDDKAYQEYIETDFQNVEGGFGRFLDTALNHVPFFGWGWFEAVPGVRSRSWTPPDKDDDWRSEEDDGLIGMRRLAWRDSASFQKWELNPRTKKLMGMWQQDYGVENARPVLLPLNKSLHLTFGDPNNPEGSTPLESVWRLERIKFGLEVVQGIGYEHAAGHLSVEKETEGAITQTDKDNAKAAARAVLMAQEGNFALWPHGLKGQLIDATFQAGVSILDAIKHYSIMVLSIYMMQFVALNTFTNTGALASQTDSTDIAVTTYNAILDGFAAQYDEQVGKRLYSWNKDRFPGLTKRPTIKFSHLTRDIALEKMGGFLTAIRGLMPLGEDDLKAIRSRTDFLPATLPETDATLPQQQPFDPYQSRPVDPRQQEKPVPVEQMAQLINEIHRVEQL